MLKKIRVENNPVPAERMDQGSHLPVEKAAKCEVSPLYTIVSEMLVLCDLTAALLQPGLRLNLDKTLFSYFMSF